MPTKSNVTSVDALESFRANLIIYLSKARPTLEEVSSDVIRTRQWLQSDKRIYWESEVRRRGKKLEDAKQAVFSAQLSKLRDTSAAEIAAVNKAQRALDEAEAKLNLVKKWNRDFESRMQPLVRQLERLNTFLANDLPVAIAGLTQTVKTLQDYANTAPPAPIGSAPASGANAHEPPAQDESSSTPIAAEDKTVAPGENT